jgi:small-conductance mechanosensitive channel
MEAIQKFLQYDLTQLAIPFVVMAVIFIAGYVARRLLFRALHRWAVGTKTQADDIVIHAFSGPFMIWVLILGIFAATQLSELSESAAAKIGQALLILWISSLTIVVSRLASDLIKYYGNRMRGGALPVTSLTQNLARIVIFTVGFLIVLNQLGLSIAPILTALGVGGLAVALALQDTLSNLFAGFYVSLAGHIRPGDYVKLDSGEEGSITDISWRSTTIKTGANNLIVVPNAKLAQAIVTNYHLPEKKMIARLPISVSYHSDPDTVERILIEEAQAVSRARPDLLTSWPPVVRFIPGFGDSSLDFTLYFEVQDFEQQFPAQHELRRRLFKRFRDAGIEIPFPIRTVYLRSNSGQNVNAAAKDINQTD